MDRARSRTSIRKLIRSYRRTLETDRRHLLEQFRFVDLARKVVGVGSVGTRAWIALFLGADEQDPLFLQIKEAQPSVLEQFVGKSEYSNCGQRVVAGQRLMQATSDIFLGWQHISSGLDGQERDFYVRQLKDWKGSLPSKQPSPRARPPTGERAAGRSPAPMPAPATGRDRLLPRQIRRLRPGHRAFAETYADQNERDYKALSQAVESGRITPRWVCDFLARLAVRLFVRQNRGLRAVRAVSGCDRGDHAGRAGDPGSDGLHEDRGDPVITGLYTILVPIARSRSRLLAASRSRRRLSDRGDHAAGIAAGMAGLAGQPQWSRSRG